MKRISFINTIFWGFLIIFIDINIGDFDILNDILGLLMIIYGLYRLKDFSKSFLKGFYLAQISLAWQIFCTILSFSVFSKQIEVIVSLMVIGFIINIKMTYNILTGLSKLAEAQNLIDLSNRLINGFRIYALSMIITAISIFFLPIAMLFLILAMILYIFVLVQIRSAYNFINDTSLEETENSSKSGVKIFTATILIVFLPIALGIGVIGISEINIIETQPFNKYDLSENQDLILSIRSKMVNLGFKPDVTDSMPDSEIAFYENIKSVQSCQSQEFSCDGGKLVISQYVSSFNLQNYRYTIFYEWTKKPRLAHTEAIGIILNNRGIDHINQTGFTSLNLFDINDIDGNTQTYTSKDISSIQNTLHSVKKFKLANNKSADNYRGYIASNILVSSNRPWAYNNSFYYIHQSTIFNNRGMDIINLNKDKDWFSNENKDHFFKEYNVMAEINIGE